MWATWVSSIRGVVAGLDGKCRFSAVLLVFSWQGLCLVRVSNLVVVSFPRKVSGVHGCSASARLFSASSTLSHLRTAASHSPFH